MEAMMLHTGMGGLGDPTPITWGNILSNPFPEVPEDFGSDGGGMPYSDFNFFNPPVAGGGSGPSYPSFPNTPPYSGGGNSGGATQTGVIVGSALNNGLALLASIFGKNQSYNPTYGYGNYGGNQQEQGQYPVYNTSGQIVGYSPAQGVVNNVGAGLQSGLQGIGNFFGVSGTTVLLVGGVMVLFLFLKPPGRRRNPARRLLNPARKRSSKTAARKGPRKAAKTKAARRR